MLTEKEKEMHIQQLIINSPISEGLGLKIGTAVMCIVNLDMESGICNGSQGIVTGFTVAVNDITGELSPVVRFTNGRTRVITRHVWQSDEYPSLCVKQFPLCLAWALTIHKIQGATMAIAEMDLGNAIFEYGQTYVALSRIQTMDGLYLSAFHPQRIKANPIVKEFYDAMRTPMIMKPVESMTVDWKKFAYTPEEEYIKTPQLEPPVPPNQTIKNPNIKVIRL
jgi:ATP-dependent DNA helicase PIF1